MRNVRMFQITVLVMLVLVIGPVPSLADNNTARTDLQGVRVAVYGETENMVVSSEIALHAMFEWMNATVEYLSAEEIKSGRLEEFDILAMPGGQILAYFQALGTEGIDNISRWIADGGSYFGICGGALFPAAFQQFGIYNGTYAIVIPGDYTSLNLTRMNVNTTCVGPDLSHMPAYFDTLFWGSSYFIPDEDFEYIPLATYQGHGGAGMIAFDHEQGNVFFSSPHPEYEEGSMRDDTAEFDEFNDSDTEWDFLLQIAIWQVESSLPDNPNIEFPLIQLTAIAAVSIVSIVIILRKRG